jgi:DNA-binding LacI/PurR family transcriptional regulator
MLPSVDPDYRAISRHAVGMFLTRGHRSLALIGPGSVLAGDHEGEEGFEEGLQKSQEPNVKRYVSHHNGTVGDISTKLDVLLKCLVPPTAFLVSRPNNVLTVMGHLMSRGLRFPKDVALISRDNDLFLESMVPSVARYSLNPSLFARKISSLVVGMVCSGGLSAKDYRMMPEFLDGQTLG